SGKMLGPVLAGTARLAVVFGAGTWLAANQADSAGYFGLVAASMVVYGLATVAAVKLTRWGR
ncbi:MAG TPA: MATE family efflux transporter, partial [Quisquiliibacterium sp.]|nr:MATE family efflux transporter [Quisquiliibacterium sp.]